MSELSQRLKNYTTSFQSGDLDTMSQEREAFRKHMYGPMSDDELARLHQSSKALGNAVDQRAASGDHTYDKDGESYKRITQDTMQVLKERKPTWRQY